MQLRFKVILLYMANRENPSQLNQLIQMRIYTYKSRTVIEYLEPLYVGDKKELLFRLKL